MIVARKKHEKQRLFAWAKFIFRSEIVGPKAGILSDEVVDRTFWIGMLFIYLKQRIN